MTQEQKQLEILALKESFEAKSINAQEYTDGIRHIMSLPDSAKFSATKNLGLKIFEDKKLIKVRKTSIPFNEENKGRKLRVATFLNDNPEEEKEQRKFYV